MREISPSVPNARLGPTRPTRALAERAQPPEENTQRGLDSLQLTPTKEAPPLQSPPATSTPVAPEEKSSAQASKADLLGFGLTHQTSDGTLLDATGRFALGPGNLAITGQGSQARVGNTVFRSDGSSSTQLGNMILNSDGSSSTRIGNTIIHSDDRITFVT